MICEAFIMMWTIYWFIRLDFL